MKTANKNSQKTTALNNCIYFIYVVVSDECTTAVVKRRRLRFDHKETLLFYAEQNYHGNDFKMTVSEIKENSHLLGEKARYLYQNTTNEQLISRVRDNLSSPLDISHRQITK